MRFVFPIHRLPLRSEIWDTLPRTETIRSHNSRAGKPSNLSPVSREMISDSVELWETDVCFLHIQLIGTNVWLPKTHNVPPSGFWVFKVSWELSVLKQCQFALFSSITHMTILSVLTCVMNVRNQTSHSFVTSSGPFGDCSCKTVYWPQNVWFTNPCQVLAFQNNLRAYIWQFSNRFHFFFFELMVIKVWSWYSVELLSRLVSQLAISFHTFLGMTSHVKRPWRNTKILREW